VAPFLLWDGGGTVVRPQGPFVKRNESEGVPASVRKVREPTLLIEVLPTPEGHEVPLKSIVTQRPRVTLHVVQAGIFRGPIPGYLGYPLESQGVEGPKLGPLHPLLPPRLGVCVPYLSPLLAMVTRTHIRRVNKITSRTEITLILHFHYRYFIPVCPMVQMGMCRITSGKEPEDSTVTSIVPFPQTMHDHLPALEYVPLGCMTHDLEGFTIKVLQDVT